MSQLFFVDDAFDVLMLNIKKLLVKFFLEGLWIEVLYVEKEFFFSFINMFKGNYSILYF